MSFWTIAGLILLAGFASAFEGHTNGDSGDTCGPEDRKCLAGHASCNPLTDDCECHNPPYAYGDGYVNCYKNNTFRTEVFNDPQVRDYNGDSANLPLPCRYFWTHTKTHLKDRSRNRVGYCYFQAYAFHQKARGKFYVGGYDVAIKLVYDNGTEASMSIRKYGKANDGDYSFFVNATDGQYLPQGDWEDDVIDYHDPRTNLRIKCDLDNQNNLAVINARKCGIRIQFRPYDLHLRRDQPMIPHIAYGVNCAFQPLFLNMDKVVAIPPAADHGGMTLEDVLVEGLDAEQTLVYRALYSMAEQNAPFPNGQCALSSNKLDNCDRVTLPKAFNNCLWILKLPRFIRCYDETESGEPIMALFNKCVDVMCNGVRCAAVISDIVTSGCSSLSPPLQEVTDFVNGEMCN